MKKYHSLIIANEFVRLSLESGRQLTPTELNSLILIYGKSAPDTLHDKVESQRIQGRYIFVYKETTESYGKAFGDKNITQVLPKDAECIVTPKYLLEEELDNKAKELIKNISDKFSQMDSTRLRNLSYE